MSVALDTHATELAQSRARARLRPAEAGGAVEAEATEGYAGLVTRAIAFALDSAIVNGCALLVAAVVALGVSVLPLPSEAVAAIAAAGAAIWTVWSIGYFAFFWSSTGQTPGCRAMSIRVLDARGGGALRPRRAVLRFAGVILAAIPLLAGFWMMLWDERRRCLQDRIARTTVVYEASEPSPWGQSARATQAAQRDDGGATSEASVSR